MGPGIFLNLSNFVGGPFFAGGALEEGGEVATGGLDFATGLPIAADGLLRVLSVFVAGKGGF